MRARLSLFVPLAAASLLSACVVVPAHRAPVYGAPPPVYGAPAPVYSPGPVVYAPMAPPPPQVEVVPVIPFPGAIWISGYWGWSGRAHAWVPGRWEAPRHGYRWEPHRWEPAARGGYELHGGGWRNR